MHKQKAVDTVLKQIPLLLLLLPLLVSLLLGAYAQLFCLLELISASASACDMVLSPAKLVVDVGGTGGSYPQAADCAAIRTSANMSSQLVMPSSACLSVAAALSSRACPGYHAVVIDSALRRQQFQPAVSHLRMQLHLF